jgi:hypothetical protein
MSHRKLDAGSLLFLRAFRAVRVIPVALLGFYFIATWFFGAPRVSGVAILCLFIVWFSALALVAKRIRCPYCANPAVASSSPSWLKVPPLRQRVQCAHCNEIIDAAGGASPPSNISLEQSRDG